MITPGPPGEGVPGRHGQLRPGHPARGRAEEGPGHRGRGNILIKIGSVWIENLAFLAKNSVSKLLNSPIL